VCVPLGVCILLLVTPQAWGVSLLAPSDPIIAIDSVATSPSSSPSIYEGPANVLDADSATKYVNEGEANSGFIVTPTVGATSVQCFMITTANDHEERDPAEWELWGTNETIASTDNSTGLGETWTSIDSGTLMLPTERLTDGPVVSVSNNLDSYTSYKMLFASVKDSQAANSMQFADIAFYESDTGPSFLSPSDPALAINTTLVGGSSYNEDEAPPEAIDDTVDTKYLNFGKEGMGFIVTPAAGASVITSFQIATANDHDDRDPASWELYGTNDPITSEDNSMGKKENWVLIASGDIELPLGRKTLADEVFFSNDIAYTSYKMVFPTLRTPGSANSMQFSEIQFFGTLSSEPIPGDADDSGTVDKLDAQILAQNWGDRGAEVGWGQGDFDGDHVVGPKDAAIMAANWGYGVSPPESTAVPEPSTALLLLGLAVGVLGCRRRRKVRR